MDGGFYRKPVAFLNLIRQVKDGGDTLLSVGSLKSVDAAFFLMAVQPGEPFRSISEESWKKLENIVEQEMLTPEEIRDNLEVTEKGRIRQSIQNCKYVLEHDPCLRGAVCRNEMTCQIDGAGTGRKERAG